MKKNEKAQKIQTILNELCGDIDQGSFLEHHDPYTLLVAVLLSAQCTDARVNQTTPHLFAKARTPSEMIQLSPEDIREIIKPCGLSPTKSKAIWNLSHILINEHDGQVPPSLEDLEKLPGVGHKTASVVMAQAFGVPMFPVDTHIHRLAARWGLSNGSNVRNTERDLKALFPKEDWNLLHLQIIQFGRNYCPARYHDLTTCPICSWAATKKRIREERERDTKARTRKPKKKTTKTTKKPDNPSKKQAKRTPKTSSTNQKAPQTHTEPPPLQSSIHDSIRALYDD